jgi:hypothetical protein
MPPRLPGRSTTRACSRIRRVRGPRDHDGALRGAGVLPATDGRGQHVAEMGDVEDDRSSAGWRCSAAQAISEAWPSSKARPSNPTPASISRKERCGRGARRAVRRDNGRSPRRLRVRNQTRYRMAALPEPRSRRRTSNVPLTTTAPTMSGMQSRAIMSFIVKRTGPARCTFSVVGGARPCRRPRRVPAQRLVHSFDLRIAFACYWAGRVDSVDGCITFNFPAAVCLPDG